MTSVVVRSWRCTKDSVGPRSAVEREKWESTIYYIVLFVSQFLVRFRNLSGSGIGRKETDSYLDVQRTGHHVTDHEISQCFTPRPTSQ